MHRLLYPPTLILVLALTGGFATDASAACPGPPALASPNGGPFYIEGVVGDTLGVPCNNSGVAPGATKVTDPADGSRELGPANASNTKVNPINTAPPPMLDFTNPNGQTDLNTIYTQSAVASGHLWFYFGWGRDANSGSGFIAVELERTGVPNGCVYDAAGIDMILPQSAAETTLINNCNPWSGRAGDGTSLNSDLMILWDQQGGSKTIYVRYFNSQTGKFGVAQALNAAQAVAEYSPDGYRGEAAVDLTAIVNPSGQTTCLTFANIIPGTVTGNSDTADYKDTVLAAFPFASSCGSLNVKKITKDPGGNVVTNLSGTFRYTLNRSGGGDMRYSVATLPTPDNPCTSPGCVETLASSTRTFTAGNQTRTHSDLIGGTDYRLSEDTSLLGTQWQFVNITCAVGTGYPTPDSSTSNPLQTIHVDASATTWCVITNIRLKTTPSESTVPSAKVYLFDSVSITGIVETSAATRAASVKFGLYDNSACAIDVPNGKHQIGSDATVTLSYGDPATTATANTLSTDGIQVFNFAGDTYYWKVTYPGDSLNNAFVTCGAAAIGDLEHTTVTVTHGIN
jgi:hypothetical protein